MLATRHLDPLQQLLLADDDGPGCGYAGLRLAPFPLAQPGSQFDLQVEVRQGATSTAVVFRYDTDLFDGSTVEQLAGRYARLLEVAVREPDTPVTVPPLAADLDLLRVLAMATGEL
jgi:non-ribosomal peptide synthetase component F